MTKAYIIAAAVAGVLVYSGYIYLKGRSHERTEIERENIEAGAKGNETSMSFRDCIDGGGVWNFETGKCGRD